MIRTIIVCLVFMAEPAAASCDRPAPSQGNTLISPANINQTFFNRLLTDEVSYQRCRKGLPQVRAAVNLRHVARDHSIWMARDQTLSHTGGRRGYETLSDRFERRGLRFRRASENIVQVWRYKLDMHRRYRVGDADNCVFSTRAGQRIDTHSYTSLARHVVDLWMKSPGHARNIFDPYVTFHGGAVAFDPQGSRCGHYYVTQNFWKPMRAHLRK